MKHLTSLILFAFFAQNVKSQVSYYTVYWETLSWYDQVLTDIEISSFGLKVKKEATENTFQSVYFQKPIQNTTINSEEYNRGVFFGMRHEIKSDTLNISPFSQYGLALISRLFSRDLPVKIKPRNTKYPDQYSEVITLIDSPKNSKSDQYNLNLNFDSKSWQYARLTGKMEWNKSKNQLFALDAELISSIYVGTYDPNFITYRIKIVEEKEPRIIEFIECNSQ